jgi:hypothetical protein
MADLDPLGIQDADLEVGHMSAELWGTGTRSHGAVTPFPCRRL